MMQKNPFFSFHEAEFHVVLCKGTKSSVLLGCPMIDRGLKVAMATGTAEDVEGMAWEGTVEVGTDTHSKGKITATVDNSKDRRLIEANLITSFDCYHSAESYLRFAQSGSCSSPPPFQGVVRILCSLIEGSVSHLRSQLQTTVEASV